MVVVQCHLVAKEQGPCVGVATMAMAMVSLSWDARADSIYVQSLVKSRVYASFVVSLLGGEVRMEYYGWWYWSTAVEYFWVV